MKYFFKKIRGFTLVEIMVAISVLCVGIFGVVSMFYLSSKMVKSSKAATIAVQLAKEKTEETISLDYGSILRGTFSENPLASPFDVFRRQTIITYADPALGMVETNDDRGMKKIEVTVFWKSFFGAYDENVKITTLFGKR